MKKIILALTVTLFCAKAYSFGVGAAVASPENTGLSVGSIISTVSTAVYLSPVAGLVLLADNGNQVLNLSHPAVDKMINDANTKLENGEALTEVEANLLKLVDERVPEDKE